MIVRLVIFNESAVIYSDATKSLTQRRTGTLGSNFRRWKPTSSNNNVISSLYFSGISTEPSQTQVINIPSSGLVLIERSDSVISRP